MSELEGCYPGLMGMSSDMLCVSSCVTPHGFGVCGPANVTPTPVPLPTGDTPGNVLLTSVNRSPLLYHVYLFIYHEFVHKVHVKK